MNVERLWVLLLAGTCFLAGLAGGVLFGMRLEPRHVPGAFPEYHARLVGSYGLDDVSSDRLRQILAAYDEEIEALKARHVDELEPELIAAGATCRQRIRRFVIPRERQQEFDELVRGVDVRTAVPQ